MKKIADLLSGAPPYRKNGQTGLIQGEAIILAILVPLVIILGFVLTRWPQQPASETPPSLATTPATATFSATASVAPVVLPPSTTAVVTTASAPTETVGLRIAAQGQNTDYQVATTAPRTVIEVMNAAAAHGLTMTTKDFGGSLGLLVESINGLANDPTQQLYWYLYINSTRSPLGASNAIVNLGDQISWQYEAMHMEDGQ
ncbi:MAG: DUF4430 domain-containing protein [Candidatus Andersenbacteria bacterium]